MNTVNLKYIVKPVVAALALVFCMSVVLAQDTVRPRDPRQARQQQIQSKGYGQGTQAAAVAAAAATAPTYEPALNYYSAATKIIYMEQAVASMKIAGMDPKLIEQAEANLAELRKAGALIPAPTKNPFQ